MASRLFALDPVLLCLDFFPYILLFLLHFLLTQFLNTGPDAPPALRSTKRDQPHDILDGPLLDLNIQGDVPQYQQPEEQFEPQRTVTTQRTVQYQETRTTERRETSQDQYPSEAQEPVQPGSREPAQEPPRPQYPIEAKVEVKQKQPEQLNQMSVAARLETIPGGAPTKPDRDIIQPQASQRLETPPPKPPHTIHYGTAPQEFRGGAPARPTSPLAAAGNVPNQQAGITPEQARVEEHTIAPQSKVQEHTIAPQSKVQEEMVVPQAVKKEESAPVMAFQFRSLEESQTSPKRYQPELSAQTQSPNFVMPPMPQETVRTPSPEHKPMQIVEEPSITVQKVKREESAPVMQFQQQMQQMEEPPIQAQQVKVEESEPEQLQEQLSHLDKPPEDQTDSQTPTPTPSQGPETPSFTDSKPGAVQPPGVMYPTFSDRHRKAGPLKVDDTPNAGYKTLYDNKKGSRASTGR